MTNVSVYFIAAGFAIGIYQFLYRKKEEQLAKQTEELKLSQAHKDKVYSIIDRTGPFRFTKHPRRGLSEFRKYLC